MKVNSLIIASIFLAMLASVIRLPVWLVSAWPEWTLLMLIYWTLNFPEKGGVLLCLLTSLFQDSITGSLLGRHVLAYTLVIGFVQFTYQRLRMLDLWQQALVVFLLLAFDRGLEYWINNLAWKTQIHVMILLPALVGALLWPWLTLVLNSFNQNSRIKNQAIP